ncbi:MAG: membrane dipeptidase [Pseudomonadota bacterium]
MGKFLIRAGLSVLALAVLAGLGFLAFAPAYFDNKMNPVIAHDPYAVSDEAKALHATIPVADLHADSLLWNRNLLKRNDRGHVDLPRMREGGMFLQVLTAVTASPAGQNYTQNDADAPDRIRTLAIAQRWPRRTWDSRAERALYQAKKLRSFEERTDEFALVRSRADLHDALIHALMIRHNESRSTSRIAQASWGGLPGMADRVGELFGPEADTFLLHPRIRHAIILGIEGSHALDGDLANIDRLYDAGYRLMGLHHFFDNKLGGSLHGTSGAGLSEFGRAAVAKMREKSIIIDVAHSSEATVRDVLAMGAGPVIISHTGFNGHTRSPRNISDALMAEIAADGGLIGVGFWDDVIRDDSPAGIADAIIYGIENFGVDHIALGSDFDGTVYTRMDVSEMAAITQALMDRGVPDDDIRKVMGGNTVRFFLENLPSE